MVYGARKPPATGLRNPPTPSMSPPPCAPVAQLDRASDYESEGRAFESLRARQCKPRQVNDLPGFMFFGRECSLSGIQPPRAPRSRGLSIASPPDRIPCHTHIFLARYGFAHRKLVSRGHHSSNDWISDRCACSDMSAYLCGRRPVLPPPLC